MPENGESPGGLHNPQDPTNPQPPSKSSVHLEATVGRWPDASTDEAGAPSYPILTAPGSGRVTNWKQEQTTWQQFVERLGQVASVKECGGYVLGDFGGDGQRLKSRCRSRWAVTLDYDDGTDPGLIDRLLATGYRAAWYSSFSHKLPGKGHRYRVIVPLNRPVVGQDDYQTVAAALVDLLGAEGLDPASYLVSQLMFWPSAADLALHEQGVCTGPLADTATLLVDGALSEHRSASTPDAVAVYDGPAYAELGRAHQEQADAYVRSLLDTWRARLADAWDWPEGAQDEAGRGWEALAYQSAYSLAKVAVHPAYPLTAEEAEDEYRLALGPIGEDEHCAGKWPKALSKAESEPPEAPKWAPEPGEVFQGEGSAPRHLDELRIAEYAARTFLGDYCWAGRWHHWTGSVWAEATEVTVTEVVRQGLVRLVTDELAAGAEDARRGALVRLLSAGKLRAITGMARGLVERDPAKFDADPLLLNTPSGVVNLRTGAVQPHDPALMMTKITKHPYMPGATHPDWTKALEALEPAEIDWFQRFMGQAATGVMSPEDRLLVMQGGGANGKTTVCSALSSSLGSYATTVPEKLLTASPNDHSTELTTLQGVRFALIEETPEARQLSVKRLKDTVGTEFMTARRIRQDNVTWRATHTLVLTTNYLPRLNETDHGTWRRLALLRFRRRYTGTTQDAGLRGRLVRGAGGRGEAILAWIVEGAKRYHADGLRAVTPLMEADQREWRLDADPLSRYLAEEVEFDPDYYMLTSSLYEAFNRYLEGLGMTAWSEPTLKARLSGHPDMEAHGVQAKVVKGAVGRKFAYFQVCWMTRVGDGGGTYRAWHGLRYRGAEVPYEADETEVL